VPLSREDVIHVATLRRVALTDQEQQERNLPTKQIGAGLAK
jgi:hypothetical protein